MFLNNGIQRRSPLTMTKGFRNRGKRASKGSISILSICSIRFILHLRNREKTAMENLHRFEKESGKERKSTYPFIDHSSFVELMPSVFSSTAHVKRASRQARRNRA